MKAKAYLIIAFNTKTIPPVVQYAQVTSSPLSGLSLTGYDGIRLIEIMHVKGNTYEQAEESLYRQVQGVEICMSGDLRFLWPFLDPSEEAHRKRYEFTKLIVSTVEVMPQNPDRPRGYPPFVGVAMGT